jgi:Family of unknown function (DUF6308)
MNLLREELVDSLLFHQSSPELVASFFDSNTSFEGALLHTLPGNDPYCITLEDLFAVTMLDVSVAPSGVRRLLFDQPTRNQTAGLLHEIPLDLDIWEGGTDLRTGGPADRLWRLLQREGDRIGPVTAGKLLSRKRPRLIPIVDSVVESILRVPSRRYWDIFHNYLQSEDRRKHLVFLRPKHVEEAVSQLRILDVVLWMWGSQGRGTKNVRINLCLPAEGWAALFEVTGKS